MFVLCWLTLPPGYCCCCCVFLFVLLPLCRYCHRCFYFVDGMRVSTQTHTVCCICVMYGYDDVFDDRNCSLTGTYTAVIYFQTTRQNEQRESNPEKKHQQQHSTGITSFTPRQKNQLYNTKKNYSMLSSDKQKGKQKEPIQLTHTASGGKSKRKIATKRSVS